MCACDRVRVRVGGCGRMWGGRGFGVWIGLFIFEKS